MSSTPTDLLSEIPQSLHAMVGNIWSDWCLSCEEKSIKPQQDLSLAALGRVWACSDFVAKNCVRYPDIIFKLYNEGLESPRSMEDYRQLVDLAVSAASDDNTLMRSIRVLRQQEMMRIAWRDLNVLADDEIILHDSDEPPG